MVLQAISKLGQVDHTLHNDVFDDVIRNPLILL